MGCVIDHLRADLRVRVLSDFQDLHGNAVRAGETGVIRRMDADLVRFQIFIEWERQGRSERLTFDLKSRHGPGNGRMRQFFEDLGTEEPARPAPPPPSPTPPEAPPSRPLPRRPSGSLRGYEHRPPPAGLCLEELTVACDCDPAFHRPVVSETTGVHACLHCGAVTATRMVGDDGRFTGDAWTAHITIAVPEAHHEWLASWPRIRVVRRHPVRWPMAAELVRDDVIFLPAGRRFRSLEEVAEFEARLEADISRTPPGRRLRECGTPSARPPGGLAADFAEFSVLWQALQLRRGQALEVLTTPPEAPPSRPLPRRPSGSLRGYDHRPPPAGLCLEELTVACDCDPAFHRPVVSETTGVHACLHCGSVTATRMVGDDGRFTGDAWTAHITVAVPEAHHEWLAGWPRIRVVRRHPIRWPMAAELVRDDVIFLPAGRRFRSLEEVAEFEARLEADIPRTPPGRRLRECGTPSARPPSGLAADFAEFSVLWQALQLRRGQALEELMPYAQRRCPGRFVASELILDRPDRTEVTLDALWSSNPEWQSAGHVLALGLRPTPPELVTTVLQLLEDFPMLPNPEVPGRIAGCGRFESLLLLLADLGVNGPEVISVLQRLLRKVLQHDLQLVDPIRIVLRELRGDPAPSGFFLP